MGKRILLSIGAVVLVATLIFNICLSINNDAKMSGTVLANIEALTKGEVFGYIWTVTYYSVDHWECNPGGTWCCPHPSGGCL